MDEIVLSGFQNKTGILPFYTKKQKDLALKKMEELEIENLKSCSFKELSGGQQQRVLLARALCAAKDLIILDEPVTGLDPIVTDELYGIIRKLNKEEKVSVIMVSHDVHRAVQNANYILQMNKEVSFFGTSKEYQESSFYKSMTNIEVCETHLCNHCGTDCNATHIHTHINSGWRK